MPCWWICIYWVLIWCFETINASNQGIIYSFMIFQLSCFILYFIFSTNLVVFYGVFYVMTSPRYYDVTHFLTDPNDICTAYVKLEMKDKLFMRILGFSEYLLRKLRLITKITYIVPSPLGRPLGLVLLGTHLSYTWGYFFNTQKIVFT